jgi:16S rRNA (uracil1498-N3)-methyltransferase
MQRLTIDPAQLQGQNLLLTKEQRHYLQRVLRLQDGSEFQAIDGTGTLYLAEVRLPDAQIIAQISGLNTELSVVVTLVIAIPKGNGIDDVIRACTELGVREIYPVTSDRTIPQPSSQKQQRWVKIAQEAAEQSERLFVPFIQEVQPWSQVMPILRGQRLICEARGESPHLLSSIGSSIPLSIAIGPEGGWTEDELNQSIEQGWQPVSLGRRILRSITAPITVMSMVSGFMESAPTIKISP